MKKAKIARCPFCGNTPTGTEFCGTARGPVLMCDCGAQGPFPCAKEIATPDTRTQIALEKRAVALWNGRATNMDSYRLGIEAAAEFVEQFDKYVDHSNRLSDCIRAKYGVIGKRKIRESGRPSVAALCAAIHYYQVCFAGKASPSHPERARAAAEFEREMKRLHLPSSEACKGAGRRTK